MIDSSEIISSLKVFSDPVTDFMVDQSADLLRIRMIRGEEREYQFDLASGSVLAIHDGKRRYHSFASLLGSAEFVDLKRLRATQRRMLQNRDWSSFLDPAGQIMERDEPRQKLSLESFRTATNYAASDRLAIVLVDGPAGIGKTTLIERLVYERSAPDSDQPPMLHVTSGGSRLTDLVKALAYATQVLRSQITFDQVPILARLGVLQVAIDGFDELVDPDGYKDAWSALRDFLRDVRCGGPVILSGRDTFFDQQGFEKRLIDRIPNLCLQQARLMSVSVDAAAKFLEANDWLPSQVREAREAGWFKPGSYQLRPFFLHQLAAAKENGWDELQRSYGSPQAFLVSRFVAREATLVSHMVKISFEDAERALWEFYGTVVQDMSIHEVDAVDEGFLALACEAAFEGFVDSDDLSKLAHRAGSFGLLESNGSGKMRKFPHSEIQNQFLAKITIDGLSSSAAVTSYLRRATVSAGLAEAFADRFNALPSHDAISVRDQLNAYLTKDMVGERLAANSGSLLLATLGRIDLAKLELRDVPINEARLFGKLESANLIGVSFALLDARGANCKAVNFDNCTTNVLLVNEETVFGTSIPIIFGSLQIDSEGQVAINRDPIQRNTWIKEHSDIGRITNADYELPLMVYFDRLCRKFGRQHQIRANAEDDAYYMIENEYWKEIRKILGPRIQEVVRDTSGPRDFFYRMVKPEAFFVRGSTDDETRKIMDAVVVRARELARN